MNSDKLILFIAANPAGSRDTQWEKEFRAIRKIITNSNLNDYYSLKMQADTTPNDFLASLNEKPWFIHFCGHGSNNGQIVLIKEDKQKFIVRTEDLMASLKNIQSLECMFFSSCLSAHLIEETQKIVNYSIGFEKTIQNADAIAFAEKFYQNLNEEEVETIPNAYQRTLEALNFEQRTNLKPVLKSRSVYIMNEIIMKGNNALAAELTYDGLLELKFLEFQKRVADDRIKTLELSMSNDRTGIQTVCTQLKMVLDELLKTHAFSTDIFWFMNERESLVHQIGRNILPNESVKRRGYYCNELNMMFNFLESALCISDYSELDAVKEDFKAIDIEFDKDLYKIGFDELVNLIEKSHVSQRFIPFFRDNVKYVKSFLN